MNANQSPISDYTDGERVSCEQARELIGDAKQIFHDDLGGGSEAITAYRLSDGRALVWCTGTGQWLLPADADVEEMCIQAAHGCYVAAEFDSPYADHVAGFKRTKKRQRVAVWSDPEWNEDGPSWIVSVDDLDEDGDVANSMTASTHAGIKEAITAGEALAEARGLPLKVSRFNA